ncbi:hypothetical protein LCGC14_0267480 [marine sediment metagenome]|uniref:Uncharacterized protein n=1 Tax=marine sediment metagenome TaxID=412755 RepID=A0A0F9UGS5_9ZZZZ
MSIVGDGEIRCAGCKQIISMEIITNHQDCMQRIDTHRNLLQFVLEVNPEALQERLNQHYNTMEVFDSHFYDTAAKAHVLAKKRIRRTAIVWTAGSIFAILLTQFLSYLLF